MGRPRTIAAKFADQVTVRMPDGLREALGVAAAKNGRSTNTEIVMRLQDSLAEVALLDADAVRAIVREEVAAALEAALSKWAQKSPD